MFVTYYQLASHLCVALAVCAGCCTHLLHPCISRHLKLHRQYPALLLVLLAVCQTAPWLLGKVPSTSRRWEPHRRTEHVSGLLVALQQRCAVNLQGPSLVMAVVRRLCAVHGRSSSCCERLAQDSLP